jgi:hypothetical protein
VHEVWTGYQDIIDPRLSGAKASPDQHGRVVVTETGYTPNVNVMRSRGGLRYLRVVAIVVGRVVIVIALAIRVLRVEICLFRVVGLPGNSGKENVRTYRSGVVKLSNLLCER